MKTLIIFILFSLNGFSQNADERPTFNIEKIIVGSKTIDVEIADNPKRRQFGLMHKPHLKENEGMLFVFEKPEKLSFWMKNTMIPLSIGYFSKQGVLLEVLEMEPQSELELNPPTYPSTKEALFALEMNKGWFKKNKIVVGARLKRPKLKKSKNIKSGQSPSKK